jgi:hypothetical protein
LRRELRIVLRPTASRRPISLPEDFALTPYRDQGFHRRRNQAQRKSCKRTACAVFAELH